ncbi:hypothetical protein, partial [Nonomuraea sp. NPDC003709]|uniref:hypothetical protein n=1 Tax=Nonomuraea sp. NPDC003709 TaxID=3154450 RepID=UPI0033B6A061
MNRQLTAHVLRARRQQRLQERLAKGELLLWLVESGDGCSCGAGPGPDPSMATAKVVGCESQGQGSRPQDPEDNN